MKVNTQYDPAITSNKLDLSIFKVDDVVELITKSGMCIVGAIIYNADNIIRLNRPCKTSAQPMQHENNLQFVTVMLPWRTIGESNTAEFSYSDISNVSKVEKKAYLEMWKTNIIKYDQLWLEGSKTKTSKETT